MGGGESSCGRSSCCRTREESATEWSSEREAAADRPASKVRIRTTITEHDIGLTLEDMEARQGIDDPDLAALRKQIGKNQAERAAEEADEAAPRKRSKGRKGTAAPKGGMAEPPAKAGVRLDVEENAPEADVAGPKQARLNQRKATGALKGGLNQFYEPDDEEWGDDDCKY